MFGHFFDNHADQQQQVAAVDGAVGKLVFGQQAGPAGVILAHRTVVEAVVDGVASHAEEVGAKCVHGADRSAVAPYFEENILRDVLCFGVILEHTIQEFFRLRSIFQVKRIKSGTVVSSQCLEVSSFFIHYDPSGYCQVKVVNFYNLQEISGKN